MISGIPPNREEFEQQVRDCLLHFYDYVYLQGHPLLDWIVPGVSGANRVQKFRQVITEIIESMRPASDVSFHSRDARPYNILTLRYLERQQAQEIPQQLALSNRQFYREHTKALEVLSCILWERITGAPSPEPPSPEVIQVSVQSEIERLHNPAEASEVDLNMLLEGVIATLHDVADQHHIEVSLKQISTQVPVQADRNLLRQVLIWMLAQLIKHLPKRSRVIVDHEVTTAHYQVDLFLSKAADKLDLADLYKQQDTFEYLIKTLRGRLMFPQPWQVTLFVPRQQSILVIDDNPDIITLFERYLTNHTAGVLGAHSAEQAFDIAQQTPPILIVLDIMLPGHDGWEILQNLKSHPHTRLIPVLVCSVLDVRDLSYLFGAEGFLKKPPGQAEFLEILTQLHI